MEQKLQDFNPQLSIRSYSKQDQNSVIGLWQACGLFPLKSGSEPVNELVISSALPNGEILLGELEGDIVATVFVASTGINCWVWDLAVHPSYQNQGFGKEMLNQAENWARRHKAQRTMLFTSKKNSSLRNFYESMNYREVNHTVLSREL